MYYGNKYMSNKLVLRAMASPLLGWLARLAIGMAVCTVRFLGGRSYPLATTNVKPWTRKRNDIHGQTHTHKTNWLPASLENQRPKQAYCDSDCFQVSPFGVL